MRIPEKAPDLIFLPSSEGLKRAMRFLASGKGKFSPEYAHLEDVFKFYLHWDKVRHWPMPPDFTVEEFWRALKISRTGQSRYLPLSNKTKQQFFFCIPNQLHAFLHWLDAKAAVEFSALGQDSGLGGIFDEAFYSSALEGATTTRRIAADLIRRVRRPNDKSEWMTFNNHRMLRAVYDTQGEPLTPATVLEFHRILTEGTLDNPSDCGRLRQTDDIRVLDENGRELHKPPLAAELSKRLENLCDFANGKKPDYFIHPAIRAMLLHFKLAYDHPFVDGNGRTARGLFYWAMERAGYGFVKHASISRILTDAPALYSRAFLYTETDGNDATYFLMHQRRILRRAVSNTLVYLRKKTAERDRVKEALNHARIRGDFNHRQIALLEHALRYPDYHYFMEGHRAAHGISYQTARNDVQALEKAGLLRQIKARGAGGRRYYVASPKLIAELEKAP